MWKQTPRPVFALVGCFIKCMRYFVEVIFKYNGFNVILWCAAKHAFATPTKFHLNTIIWVNFVDFRLHFSAKFRWFNEFDQLFIITIEAFQFLGPLHYYETKKYAFKIHVFTSRIMSMSSFNFNSVSYRCRPTVCLFKINLYIFA